MRSDADPGGCDLDYGFWGTTASDGTYTIGGLAPGSFGVSFQDPSGTYARGYYSSAGFTPRWHDLTTVSVPPDADGIDVQLPLGLHISGTVTGPGGTPLAGIIIGAFYDSGGAWAETAANGTYTVGGLSAGSFEVSFDDPSGTYALGYYSSAGFTLNRRDATPVSVLPDATGIDVELPLATNPTISGTVTAGGSGVAGAIVYVFDAGTDAYVGNTTTGAGGAYTVSLAPGTYKLWIQTNTQGYPDQAYGPDGSFENATPLDLATGSKTADVVLAAASTRTVSGTVSAAGTGVAGAIVYAFDAASSAYVGNAFTTAGGAYTLALPAGTYKLWVQTNTAGYPDQAYGPDGSFANATPVDLTAGHQTANVVLAGS